MEQLNRRKLIAGGGSAALLAAIAGQGAVAEAGERRGRRRRRGRRLNYPDGSLNADGTVKPGADTNGAFRCWGWIFDAGTGAGVVAQEFALNRRGTIQIQGLEGDVRAVTGGTGRFRNARGQARVEVIKPPTDPNFSFRAAFELLGG